MRKLRALLTAYREAGGTRPIVLLHDDAHGTPLIDALARFGDGLPANVLPLAVNEVTQVGLEAIAAGFAYGASAMRFLLRAKPRHDVAGLAKTLALAEPILAGLGFGAGRAATIETDDPDALGTTLRAIDAAAGSAASRELHGRRAKARRHAACAARAAARRARAGRRGGAARGRAVRHGRARTSRAARSASPASRPVRPARSLDDPERPMLRFAEDACVQCGLCKATCPEKVITLQPQLDFRAATATARVLKEEEPFHCIRCGKPFGVKSTIERVTAKLEGKHWMFQELGAAPRRDQDVRGLPRDRDHRGALRSLRRPAAPERAHDRGLPARARGAGAQGRDVGVLIASGGGVKMAASRKQIRTSVLEIAYEESGPADGVPVFLMHGWPYDPRTYDEVVPRLVAAGCRTIVPYLRGFGPTRFLRPDTPRSGQQAALGNDLKELMDALGVERAVLAGYDWGGRAACVVAALWPERVRGLVSANGYNIHDVAASAKPAAPEQEQRLWYQYYFHTERGRAGLAANRRAFCKLHLADCGRRPGAFDDATYDRTAASFDNPDFVEVVIHSYRCRFGYAPGDPAWSRSSSAWPRSRAFRSPTIVLHGGGSALSAPESSLKHASFFTGAYQHRIIPDVGHNLPQEAPAPFAGAVLELLFAPQLELAPLSLVNLWCRVASSVVMRLHFDDVAFSRNRISAARSSAEPIVCSGILVPGV